MRRALVVAALLLLSARSARGDYGWQEPQNTNGYVSVVSPPGGSCFLYQTAAFDIQCYTAIPSGFVSVPNGVLEGVANAITGYTATPAFVQFGAASGGGLAQSTNLQWDGTYFKLGTHVTSPQPALRALEQTSSATTLNSYPASGTNVANLFRITPRGTGSAGLVVDNTDVWSINPTEQLLIQGHGTNGFAIATNFFFGGSNRPISIGTDDPSSPVQIVLNTDGTTSFGTGDLLLNRAAAQAITKSSGALTIGTTGANAMTLKTNGSTAVTIDPTQGFTFPTFAGGGNQCAQFDNTGKLGVTGSACGSGGLGGASGTVTNVTGTPPIFITGTPASTPNVTIQGAIVSGSTSTTAQNTGSLTTGIAKLNVAAGVNTFSTAAAGTDYQVPLTACTNYVSLTCVTGATDLGGTNATPTVIGIENDAAMRGDLLATDIAAPATPSVGTARIYVDSTSKNLAAKNDLGTVVHGIQTFACSASQFAIGNNAAGASTCAQPNFTDLAGSEACGQTPAFTGDVTKTAGSCATVVSNLPDGTTQAGSLVATEIATPAAPSTGKLKVYASTNGVLAAETPFGGVSHTASTLTCGANQWFSAFDNFGAFTCAQPAFSNVSGSATCAQVAGTKTLFDGGSCAGTAWNTSGTWTNGQALITSGGAVTTTNQCNVFATCAAGGGLAGTYPNPSVASVPCSALPAFSVGDVLKSAGSCTTEVISVTDLASVQWAVGTWVNDQMLITSSVGSSIKSVPRPPAQLAYFGNGLNPAIVSGWMSTASTGVIGPAVEYPLGLASATATLRVHVSTNTLTGGPALFTDIHMTQNGVDIGGVRVNNGVTGDSSNTITAAGATSDTWGMTVSGNGTPSGNITLSATVSVTP